jgi:Arc/MetJ family transcription regulator
MSERWVDVDDGLLAAAQKELGTVGVTDTVRLALGQVVAGAARRRQVAWLRQGGLEEMADPRQRSAVWRRPDELIVNPDP